MVLQVPGRIRPYVIGDTVEESSPPTSENVNDIFKEYSAYYRNFHHNCGTEETYYYGSNKVPIPTGTSIAAVRPATAHAIINVSSDHVDVNNPSFFVPEPSPRAKDRALGPHPVF